MIAFTAAAALSPLSLAALDSDYHLHPHDHMDDHHGDHDDVDDDSDDGDDDDDEQYVCDSLPRCSSSVATIIGCTCRPIIDSPMTKTIDENEKHIIVSYN